MAGIWSCDLRTNERPRKKTHEKGTDRHTDRHTDRQTIRLLDQLGPSVPSSPALKVWDKQCLKDFE